MQHSDHRSRDLLWLAALVAGASYYGALRLGLEGPAIIAWKGAGVGLLAVWGAFRARGADGWLIVAVMALGASGDILVDAANLRIGGSVFLVAHLVAIVLFVRNRRESPAASQKLLGVALLIGVPTIAFAISPSGGQALVHAVYGLALGAMAASAWISRFSRYRVGIGAVLFVLSDLLIFARSGPLAGSALPALLIWPLYFAGQALIVRGVVTAIERDAALVN